MLPALAQKYVSGSIWRGVDARGHQFNISFSSGGLVEYSPVVHDRVDFAPTWLEKGTHLIWVLEDESRWDSVIKATISAAPPPSEDANGPSTSGEKVASEALTLAKERDAKDTIAAVETLVRQLDGERFNG